MNLEVLIKQLEIDEGLVEAVYLDHLNLKTVGIGGYFSFLVWFKSNR